MPSLFIDGTEYPVDGPCTLGRQRTNQIPLKDEAASRVHARIFPDSDQWFLEDLGSANGTKIKGRRIDQPVLVKDGLIFSIGRTQIEIRLREQSQSTGMTTMAPHTVIEVDDPRPGDGTHRLPGSGLHSIPTPKPADEDYPGKGGGAVVMDDGEIDLSLPNPLQPTARTVPVGAVAKPSANPTPERAQTRRRGSTGAIEASESGPPADITKLAGRTLGGIRLELLMKRDRLGAVYRGHQVAMQRHVAVKIFDPAIVGGDLKHLKERFLANMAKLSAIHHECLVRVHDSGMSDGVVWVATELAEGMSLTKRLAEMGPLAPDVALRLGEQLLAALSTLHVSNLVHGMMHSDLVFIDEQGRAQLADLGVVGMGALPDPADNAPADQGWFAGPFPVKGMDGNPRNDLYALGVVVYMGLTGKPPFEGRNAGEVMRNCKDSSWPQLIKHAAANGWPAGMPTQRIEALLKGLLGRDPAWHYASTSQVAEELLPLTSDAATAMLIRPPEAWYSWLAHRLGVKWKTVGQIAMLIAFVVMVLILMTKLQGVLR